MIYVVLMGTSSMMGTHSFWDGPTYFQKNFTKIFKRLYNVGLPWWLIGKEFGSQMQETHVRSLVREDLTCRGATKPACHSYRAWEQLGTTASEACLPESPCSTTREATAMRSRHTTTKSRPRSPQLEKSLCSNKDPAQPKIKINNA